MDLRRLRAGEYVLALSGAGLIVSLFLPWYERGGSEVTGWQAFTVVDGVLAAIGAAALATVFLAATQRTAAIAIAVESLMVLFGLAAAALALIRVIDVPGLGPGYGLAGGAWAGLAAAVGVAAGALVAIRDERLSRPGRPTDPTGRPTSGAPEIRTLPPPEGQPR